MIDQQPFVHLHVHSEFSLLDGLSRINDLVQRAVELNQPAVALTDHGAMYGTMPFYRAAKSAGIKPIIGIETYLAMRGMGDRDAKLDKNRFHMLLLAQNQTGYLNLLQVASAAQLEGFYYKPRIDRSFMAAHSEGIIATTGCMAGEIPRAIGDGNMKLANQLMGEYLDIFGKDRLYIELQEHHIPELTDINKKLIEMATRFGLENNFLATNDVHYTRAEDANSHETLLCIQTGSTMQNPKLTFSDKEYYLKSHAEMAHLFGEIPGALSNSLLIAEMCDVNLDSDGYHLPEFDVPDGYDAHTYLRHLCEKGLIWRYGEDRAQHDEELRARLDHEMGIINRMGFDTYFLIVWDLCEWAARRDEWYEMHQDPFPHDSYQEWKDNDIWWNVRGSGAGSVVAYTLGITSIDPLVNGLIFERFLNPGRVSMPDIDLDYPDDMRGLMVAYTKRRYGAEKVAQIITFGTMGARAAIRDVGRAMDMPLPEVDGIARLIPAIPGKPAKIKDVLDSDHEFYSSELKERYKRETAVKTLLNTAQSLEGVVRHASSHAAGVIVSDKPLVEYVPLNRPTSGHEGLGGVDRVTQWPMEIVESIGLLKVDFLGLSTLTVMRRAARLIEERYGTVYTMDNIPYDEGHVGPDPAKKPEALFDMLTRGEVAGVFQVEGAGMRRLMMEMRPSRFNHIVAAISLYRPGPMDNIPSYIRRMHGEEAVEFHHPDLEPILGNTYGICVSGDSLVMDARTGHRYRLDELGDLDDFLIQGVDEQWETAVGRVSHWIDSGHKEVYRLTLRNGNSIKVTADHRLLTESGWQPLSSLQTGNCIAVPAQMVVQPITTDLNLFETEQRLHVRWEEIAAIEPAGVEHVYDLTVEGLHSFVANNIIVHNCIYQEQIIQIASSLAGYEPGEADMIRKAVSKKKKDLMEKHRIQFTDGAMARGYSREVCDAIWGDIEFFARYGFNRAHAADYAKVTCQTAFLKAHYAVEYLAAMLSVERDNTEKVRRYFAEAKNLGIDVAPPDVNKSRLDFTIEDDGERPLIRFGLGAIKNAGAAALSLIIDEREENGQFDDLLALCDRVDMRRVGKRALEYMIKGRVFDTWGTPPQFMDAMERIVSYSGGTHDAASKGQMSLFGGGAGSVPAIEMDVDLLKPVDKIKQVEHKDLLEWEKEALGVHVSEHPLERPLAHLLPLTNKTIGDIQATDNGKQVKVAGMISQLRTLTTKKGDPMAFGTLEDLDNKIDVVFFPRTWKQCRDVVEVDQVMLLWGKVQDKNDSVNIIVDRVRTKVENGAPQEDDDQPGYTNGNGNGNGNGRSAPPPAPPPPTYTPSSPKQKVVKESAAPPPPPNFDEESEAKPAVNSEQSTVNSEQFTGDTPPTTNHQPPATTPPIVFGSTPNGYTANAIKTIVVQIKPVGNWKEACRQVIQMAGRYNGEDKLRLEMISHGWSMDFPNNHTRICQELLVNLRRLPGVASVKPR